MPPTWISRIPEPEHMDDPVEVAAYDAADFSEVNRQFARRILKLAGVSGQAIDPGTGPACIIPIELSTLAPDWANLGPASLILSNVCQNSKLSVVEECHQ